MLMRAFTAASKNGHLRVKPPSSTSLLGSSGFRRTCGSRPAAHRRQRRDDGVDAGAVGQARVDMGMRFIDAAADRRDDLVDDAQQMLRRP